MTDFDREDYRSWADLTEDPNNEFIEDFYTFPERNPGQYFGSREGGHQPLIKSTEYKQQQQRDFDLRRRINRNRRDDSVDGYGPHMRDSYADRYRFTRRPGNMSPLRSPVDNFKRYSVRDMDNSNNFRFTSYRRGGASQYYNAHRGNTQSPLRDQNENSRRRLYLPSENGDDGDGTSERSRLRREEFTRYRRGGASRNTQYYNAHRDNTQSPVRGQYDNSRRRLHHPSENGGYGDDTREKTRLTEEEYRQRLARREKDIAYGKNTEDYKKYIDTIPIHQRSRDRRIHPKTPDKYYNGSRRSWDAQIKIWKLGLHSWAAQHEAGANTSQWNSDYDETSKTLEHTNSEEHNTDKTDYDETSGTLEHTNYEEHNTDKPEGNVELPEQDEVEEEDDSFLESVEFTSLVGEQE